MCVHGGSSKARGKLTRSVSTLVEAARRRMVKALEGWRRLAEITRGRRLWIDARVLRRRVGFIENMLAKYRH
jgi:hypothetical protein